MHDPTMESLRKLDDPALWVIVENVPIFAPHERQGKDGKPIKVDVERLHKVAEHINRRERESGVLPRLMSGHTLIGEPQKVQPNVWGLARNAKVGTFGPSNKPAVLATFYYRKEHWAEAKEYPFRSAEFYPALNEIGAIALLKTEPELDLGMLAYARSNGQEVYFYSTNGAMPMPENNPTPTLPGNRDDEIQRYQRDLDTLRGDNKLLLDRLATLEKSAKLVTYERDLSELSRAGYVFDLTKEVQYCSNMAPEQFAEHKDRIKELYQRAPVGQGLIRLADADDPRPSDHQSAPKDYDAIMQYMRSNPGCSYERAEEFVRSKSKAS